MEEQQALNQLTINKWLRNKSILLALLLLLLTIFFLSIFFLNIFLLHLLIYSLFLFSLSIYLSFQEKVISLLTFLRIRILLFIFRLKFVQLLLLFRKSLLNVVHYFLLEFDDFITHGRIGEQRNIFQCFWVVFDIIEFFEPFCKQLAVDWLLFFDFSKFFGYLSFFDVHDLLILGFNEKLFPLFPFVGGLPAGEFRIYFCKLIQFYLLDFKAFAFAIFDHAFEISLLFVDLVAVLGSFWGSALDLVEFVELQFVVGVVVVILFFELAFSSLMTFLLLLSHQQSVFIIYNKELNTFLVQKTLRNQSIKIVSHCQQIQKELYFCEISLRIISNLKFNWYLCSQMIDTDHFNVLLAADLSTNRSIKFYTIKC